MDTAQHGTVNPEGGRRSAIVFSGSPYSMAGKGFVGMWDLVLKVAGREVVCVNPRLEERKCHYETIANHRIACHWPRWVRISGAPAAAGGKFVR